MLTMANSTAAISHLLSPPPIPSLSLSNSRPIRRRRTNSLSDNPHSSASSVRTPPRFRLSSTSGDQTAAVAPTDNVSAASDVVIKFYGGINGRDLPSVVDLISPTCVYEDLIFPHPFVGRKDILEFFENFMDVLDKDLRFVIDKISTEDSSAVGVTWHLEWKGKTFPFSKGCSFYQLEILNGKRQIVYARDSVEPAIKPGKSALVIIRGLTWLLQQFPQLADRF